MRSLVNNSLGNSTADVGARSQPVYTARLGQFLTWIAEHRDLAFQYTTSRLTFAIYKIPETWVYKLSIHGFLDSSSNGSNTGVWLHKIKHRLRTHFTLQ